MNCPQCSADVGAMDQYCRSCGGKLVGTSVDQASMAWDRRQLLATEVVGAQPRWTRRIGLILLHLALAAGAALAAYHLLHHMRGPRTGSVTLGLPRLVVLAPPPSDGAVDAVGSPPRHVEPNKRRPKPRRSPVGKVATPRRTVSEPAAPDAGEETTSAVAVTEPAKRSAAPKATTERPTPSKAGSRPKQPDGEDQIDRFRAGLNAESVRMVVRHHLPQVRACYDRALKQKEKLFGLVEVRFEINAQGRVGSANVHRNTTGHEGLGKCLALIIKRWRFPKPVGGAVEFIYPFVFSAGN